MKALGGQRSPSVISTGHLRKNKKIMFYKLGEREANNHLNVPIVSSVCVCGLFYKQLSLLVMEAGDAGKQYLLGPCDVYTVPATPFELACMRFVSSALFSFFLLCLTLKFILALER